MTAFATAAVLLLFVLNAAGQDKERVSILRPCEVAGIEAGAKEKALCGSIEVFENRESKSGRKIPIKIVVFPATGTDKVRDPFLYVPGGPGSSATEDAPYVAQEFAKIRERRDLVFIDQRGTGGSNLLFCDFFDPNDLQSYLGHWNPPERVKACRTELEKKANLKLYTTSIAVDDLNDVRAALGYDKINMFGGSYGTRFAQEYLRRHGGTVRSVIMQGVSLTSQHMPGNFPADTERALDGVLNECIEDKTCRDKYPNVLDDSKRVLAQLVKAPVIAEVEIEKKKTKVSLSRDLAAEAIRYMLYQSGAASRIPWVLNNAANGNFTPLAEAAVFYRQVIVATGATGMYLSVTCAEDLPFVNFDKSMKAGAEMWLGNYRLVQQREACALWQRGDIPKDYASPVRSNVPALILSGQWDPVTPPSSGDAAAKHLPNSVHLVIPSGGHGFSGLTEPNCIGDLMTSFVNAGSAKDLDTSCVRSIRRVGFQLQ